MAPTDTLATGATCPSLASEAVAVAPSSGGDRVHALQAEVEALRREVVVLRTQRQRDLATARGLGEALQALRRGAMALRTENEDLRRQLTGRPARRR